MRTLAELQSECTKRGIVVSTTLHRKAPYIQALRENIRAGLYGDLIFEEPIDPMKLADWNQQDDVVTMAIEQDQSGWGVQEKYDGVRAILNVTIRGVRITGRTESQVTYQLSRFEENLPQLTCGWDAHPDTILDGELICLKGTVNTGSTTTASALQATTAILAAGTEKARAIQTNENAHLVFVAFDLLRDRGEDLTMLPLRERLSRLRVLLERVNHPFVQSAPMFETGKAAFHEQCLADGKEGTVWKNLNRPYQSGQRVRHWLKRKREIEVEAIVTGFKLGSTGRGNESRVGAVEFSVQNEASECTPIAWVCNWSEDERQRMTTAINDQPGLAPDYHGRKAIITGLDIAGKSGRIRHARLKRWCD